MCSELASLLLFILCANRVTIIQEEQQQDRSLVPWEDTCSLLFFPTSFQHFPSSSGLGLSLELSLPKHLVKPRYVPKFHVEISVRIILCVLPLCSLQTKPKQTLSLMGKRLTYWQFQTFHSEEMGNTISRQRKKSQCGFISILPLKHISKHSRDISNANSQSSSWFY